jgi:hypothetical protein
MKQGFAGTLKLGIFAATLLLAAAPPFKGKPADSPHARLTDKAKALVGVRFVLKVATSGAERELDGETVCLLVGADGLLLCSNNEMGGYVGLLTQIMNRGQMPAVVFTPKEIRVLLGNDSKGLPAKLIARDSDRDLAWLRLDAVPPGLALQPVDLEDQREAEVGEPLYRLRRLDRFFGSVPLVESGVVGALVAHPRKLLIAADLDGGHLGMPIFGADGKLLGMTVVQVPGGEGEQIEFGHGMPGQSSKFDDMIGSVILPAGELLKATRLAVEIHKQDLAAAAAAAAAQTPPE